MRTVVLRRFHPAKMQTAQCEQAVFAQISLPAAHIAATQGEYLRKMAFSGVKNYKITVFAHFVFPVYHTIPLNNYRWLVKSLQILLLFFRMFQYLKNPHFDGKF
ncbi:MAG: hypothetical protein II995_00305 [Oscillospiraceae bacterium]|nr:hypothetical protein [Oscillospiraceae bacterium]